MRFLLSAYGSAGDVFPMVGLALTLRNRGHDVTLATNEHFAPLARAHQLPFEPLGTDADFQRTIADPDLWHPQRSFRLVYRSLAPTLRRQYQLHVEFARRGNAAAITTCFGLGALLAHEKLGIPLVTVHYQPVVFWSDVAPPTLPGLAGPRWLKSLLFRLGERWVIDPVVCPELNAWRRELGLPPVRRIMQWWHSPYAVLAMFPAWFCPPAPDWPPNLIQTDFPLWNAGTADALPPALETFLDAGDPPIAFTPGSANAQGSQFFEAAVAACRRLGRRGVLLTGFDAQVPPDLPAGIVHHGYVPLDRLLPRCAAFVHHGGVGSASQAMATGVPQLITPLAHDQFDNAARITALGLGGWIAGAKVTGVRLAEQLAPLLASAEYATRCNATAKRLTPRDGLLRSAVAIEDRLAR